MTESSGLVFDFQHSGRNYLQDYIADKTCFIFTDFYFLVSSLASMNTITKNAKIKLAILNRYPRCLNLITGNEVMNVLQGDDRIYPVTYHLCQAREKTEQEIEDPCF